MAGVNQLQIRTRRTSAGTGCTDSGWTTVTWNTISQPVAQTITKLPNVSDVCVTGTVSATFSGGSGGVSPTDVYESSVDGGVTWQSYTPGSPISSAVAGINQLQIRTRRTSAGTGCTDSGWTTVTWNTISQPVAQTITKLPNVSDVCVTGTVSATFSGGSGGVSPTDVYESSVDGGVTWQSYTPGSPISSAAAGVNQLQIRTRRTSSGTGCTDSGWTTVTWNTISQPVAQTITKLPNVSDVCVTGTVSATFSGGSGGVSPTDVYESSVDGGVTWQSYTPGSPISSAVAGVNQLQIRTRRTSSGTGCTDSGWTTVTWNTISQPVAQTITKLPNVSDVCVTGTVSATFSGGSGGVSPTDVYESSVDGGVTWQSYTPGSPISSAIAGVNQLQIRTRRTSAGTGCTDSGWTTVTWNTISQPVAQTITKLPNVSDVCVTGTVSATFSGGSGGVSPTDVYESSVDGGVTWQSYTPGSPISSAVAGVNQLQIRTRRTSAGTGCSDSGWTTVTWNTISQPVAQTITKLPNVSDVCVTGTVSATFSGGSGGVSPTDVYESSVDGGVTWQSYTPGSPISSAVAGTNQLQIRTRRTSAGTGCSDSGWTTVTWNTISQPVAQTITKLPNVSDVCVTGTVSATFSGGSGGVSPTDVYESSVDGGVTWQSYTPGSPISSAVAGVNQLQIRTRRTSAGTGCSDSGWTTVTWNTISQPVAQTITKLPNVSDVCVTGTVSATFSGGSGGVSPTDVYESSVDGGVTWQSYTPGSPISSAMAGVNQLQIRTRRTSAGTGCTDSGWTTVTWNTISQPVAQTITKLPNVSDVCVTGTVSATFSGGSGGVSPTDVYESSVDGGVTWQSYTPGSPISSAVAGVNQLQIRTRRTSAGTGCSDSGWTTVTWNTISQPVAQTITKLPNVSDVCVTGTVSATFSGGSGGVSPTDVYESSVDGGVTWQSYTPGSPISSAVAGVNQLQIRTRRTSAGTGCSDSGWTTVTWNTISQPVAQTITKLPNVSDVCVTGTVSATFSGGSGGVSPTDVYESSVDGGVTWQSYTPGSPISSAVAGVNQLQIRTRRTSAGTGCTDSGWTTVTWNTISQPVAQTITKLPNVSDVCVTGTVSATFSGGSGGVSPTDVYESSVDGGVTWQSYTPGSPISSAVAGVNQLQIRTRRTSAGTGCTDSGWTTVTWNTISQPVAQTITKLPNVSDVCVTGTVSATFSGGSGGVSPTDVYESSVDGGVTWQSYTPGSPISSAMAGVNQLQIRTRRTSSGTGCTDSGWTTVTWNTISQPVAQTITKLPNVSDVCVTGTVSATFSGGSGGVSPTDVYESSVDGGVTWQSYTPGSPISSAVAGVNQLQIRTRRTSSGTGCSDSGWTTVTWNTIIQPIGPTLNSKTPNLATACNGQLVAATFNPGSGGVGCTDFFEYRFDGGIWLSYTEGSDLNTTGHTLIEIQGRRAGCIADCNGTGWVTLASWIIEPTPKASISNSPQTICDGAALTGMVISNLATHIGAATFDMSIVATTGQLTDLTATGNALTPVTGGSYGYTIGGTLTNNTDAAITIEYRVTPRLAGCGNGAVVTGTVTIEPTPKASISNSPQTICDGAALTGMVISNLATHIGAATFDMSIVATTGQLTDLTATGNALTPVTGGSYGYTIGGTLTNNTDAAITIEYRVTPRLAGCGNGAVVTGTVTIEPTPKASISNSPQTICDGAALTGMVISNLATHIGAATFDMSIVATTGQLTDLTATGNALTPVTGGSYGYTIGGTLTNNTDAAITIEYRVTPRLAGCGNGAVVTGTVTIEPTPKASISNSPQTICDGAALTGMVISNLATHIGAATFDMSIVATTGQLTDLTATGNALTPVTGGSYGYIIGGTLTNNTDAAITIEYRVTPRLAGCGNGAVVTGTVTIEPTPKASISNSPQTICDGAALTGMVISNLATHIGAATFDMSIVATTGQLTDLTATGNALTPVTGGSYGYIIGGTLTNNTDAAITIEYRVTPRLAGCGNGAVVTGTVTIEPTPKASISNSPQTICDGAALTGMVISNLATHIGAATFDMSIVATTGQLTDLTATGNALTPVTGGSYGYTIGGTLTNNTDAAITIEYRVTPRLAGCGNGAVVTGTVTIEPTPKASISNSPQTICDGAALTGMVISNLATHIGAATFDMSIVATTGQLTDLTATGNALTPVTGGSYGYTIGGTLTNNTDAAITIEYRVTPRLAGCGNGAVVTGTVTIEPTPKASISNSPQTICDGAALTGMVISNLATHIGAATFDMSIVATTGQLTDLTATGNALTPVTGGSYGYIIGGTLTNNTDAAITIEYRVTPRLAGCGNGAVVTGTVTIEPTPKASISNSPQTICDGAALTGMVISNLATHIGAATFDMSIVATTGQLTDLTATGNALTPVTGGSYGYTIGGTLTNNTDAAITIEYRVTPRLAGCGNGAVVTGTVTIEPTPKASISNSPQTICDGAALTGMVISNLATHIGAATFDMSIVATTGQLTDLTATGNALTPVTGGSYGYTIGGTLTNNTDAAITIEYRVTPRLAGCGNGAVVTGTVTIEPTPKASISNSPQTICDGAALTGMVISNLATHIGAATFDMSIVATTGQLTDLTATGNALTPVTGGSYGYIIGGTLTNNTDAAITIEYRVTPRLAGCGNGAVVTGTVTIEPTPKASISNSPQTICDGAALTGMVISNLATHIGAATFDMSIVATTGQLTDLTATGNALTPVTGGSYGYIIGGTLTNNTDAAITIEYRVTPRLAGCGNGAVVTGTVTIEPTPKASISNSPQTICDGAALTGMVISNLATHIGAATFDMSIVATTGQLTDLTATGNALTPVTGGSYGYTIGGTLTNNTDAAITIEYRVTPRLAGCGNGAVVTGTVTIEPTPKASISNSPQTICDGAALTGMVISNLATHIGAATFDMSIVATTGQLTDLTATGNALTPVTGGSYGYIIGGTLTNNTDAAITIEYRVTPRLAGCGNGAVVTGTVTIEPTPKASISNSPQTICDGAALTGMVISNLATHIGAATFDMSIVATTGQLTDLTATGNALTPVTGGSYGYTIGGTLTNNTDAAITIEYRVTPRLAGCGNGAVVTGTVTIEPTPKASISNSPQTICDGAALTGMVISNLATHIGAATFDMSIVATTGQLTDFTATGNALTPVTGGSYGYIIGGTLTNNTDAAITIEYRVTPRLAGCGNGAVVTGTVTIEPTPKASISNSPQTICDGAALTGMVISNLATHIGAATFDMSIVATTGQLTDLTATGNALTPVTGGSYGYIIGGTLTNNTDAAITIEYRVTPRLAGCGNGAVVTGTVTIEPTPKASISNSPQTICDGAALTGMVISNLATHIGAATFDMSIVATTGQLTDLTATGNALTPVTGGSYGYIIGGTLTNNTDAAITIEYRVTPRLAGCGNGAVVTGTVTIEPTPKASISNSPQTICDGAALTGMVISNLATHIGAATFDMSIVATTGQLTDLTATGNALTPVTGGSYGYIIGGTLTNNTDAAITIEYRVTPRLAGCGNGAVVTGTVTIEPTPKASISNSPQTICDGAALTGMVISNLATHIGAATFDMSIVATTGQLTDLTATGNALTPVTGGSYGYIIGGTLTNNTDAAITIEYRVTPRLAGCGNGAVVTGTVTIEPTPKASISNSPQTICDGAALTGMVISNLATHIGAATFDMSIVATTGQLTDLTATGNALTPVTGGSYGYIIGGTLTNNTDAAITIEYRVTPRLAGCGNGAVVTARVSINPTPQVIPSTLAQDICNDGTASVVLNSPSIFTSGVITFNYTVVATGGVTGFTPSVIGLLNNSVISDVLHNPTNDPQTVTYTIVPISPNGCAPGPAKIVVITVYPTPQVVPSTLTQTLCNDGQTNIILTSPSTFPTGEITFNYTVIATGGVTGFITPRSGLPKNYLIADVLHNPTDVFQTVTYTVVPISPLGCAPDAIKIIVVTVNPTPQVIPITLTPIICNDTPTSITLGSPSVFSNGSITFKYIAVASGSVTGFTPSATGLPNNSLISDVLHNPGDSFQTVTYSITPVSPTGCLDGPTKILTVTVNPTPRVIPVMSQICYGGTTSITLTSPTTMTQPNVIRFDYNITATAPPAIVGGPRNPAVDVPYGSILSYQYTNRSDTLQSVYYNVTPTAIALGCASGIQQPFEVKVHPKPLQHAFLSKPLLCNGGSDAIITIVLSKGSKPDSIIWTGNFGSGNRYTTSSNSSNLSNLKTSWYYITVKDNLNCRYDSAIFISGAVLDSYFQPITKANGYGTTCPESTDGVLLIQENASSTGVAPFNYTITKNGVTVRSGILLSKNSPKLESNLPPGTL